MAKFPKGTTDGSLTSQCFVRDSEPDLHARPSGDVDGVAEASEEDVHIAKLTIALRRGYACEAGGGQ